jgi:hypothetical protein
MSSHAASYVRPVPVAAPAVPEPEPLPSASPIDAHRAPVQETRRRSGRAGTALVLGILAIVCAAIPIVGLILGIVAITKGASTAADIRRTGQAGRGQAIAGEILGVIGVVASIAIPIVFGFLL